MKYDVEYFINKFEVIPKDQWCVNQFFDFLGRRCALGHCGSHGNITKESAALSEIIYNNFYVPVCLINDANNNDSLLFRELGDSPKERIVNALILIQCLGDELKELSL